MNRFKWLVSAALPTFLFVANSFAGPGGASSGVGNAGTVIDMPDGSVILSDPFVVRNNDPYQTFSNLNVAIQTQLVIIGQFLTRYGAVPDQTPLTDADLPGAIQSVIDSATFQKNQQEAYSRTAQSNFMVANVMNDQIRYYFVDTLSSECIQNEESIKIPVDQGGVIGVNNNPSPSPAPQIEMAACTIGKETFIRQDLYAKMNIRNQAMLILHERLHSLAYTEHQNIIDITVGASLILDLYRQQSLAIQNKNAPKFSDFPKLTSDQVNKIENMLDAIVNMNYLAKDGTDYDPDGEHWAIEPNGGGIYFFNPHQDANALVKDNAVVSPVAFLGVGSVLGRGGNMNTGAVMADSSCFSAACSLGANASVIESSIFAANEDAQKFSVQLDSSSIVVGSQISIQNPDPSAVVHISPFGTINASSVENVSGLQIETGATLENSLLALNSLDGSRTQIDLGAGSDMNGLRLALRSKKGPSDVSTFTLSTLPNEQLSVTSPFQCSPNLIPIVRGDLSISDLASLNGLCQPIADRPNN